MKPQPDEAGGAEVKEVRGQVVGPGAAVDEGGVNLRDRQMGEVEG